eukprot:1462442-Karenia_brevis.AAC.1
MTQSNHQSIKQILHLRYHIRERPGELGQNKEGPPPYHASMQGGGQGIQHWYGRPPPELWTRISSNERISRTQHT